MKKLIVIVLAASLAGACGSKKAETTTPKAVEPKAPDAGYGGATYGGKPAPAAANPCASQGH